MLAVVRRARVRPVLGAAPAAVLALFVLTSPTAAAAAPTKPADASYLARAAGGLHLAITIRDGRR